LRLIFAGTPAFSVLALDALVEAGHEIVAVYTQPDRPAGRGQKLSASPVAQRAAALGLPTFKPEKLRGNEAALAEMRALAAECMVVVAYGLILPQAVLDIPVRGCLNIHASLLPRWRGAAPIQRAVLAGDRQTGVTIMQMDAGLDTGPMLLDEALPISADATSGDIHDALARLGARLIVQALDGIERNALPARPQPVEGATYASKLTKEEARLDWSLPAAELLRRVHGYNPMPGAWCEWNGERIKLLRAALEPVPDVEASEPGSVLTADERGLSIATSQGVLRIIEMQRPGGRPSGPMAAYGQRPPLDQRMT